MSRDLHTHFSFRALYLTSRVLPESSSSLFSLVFLKYESSSSDILVS